MKMSKTYFFAVITFLVILSVYVFDYKADKKKQSVNQALILNYDPAQISYIQIIKPELKIALQKNTTGWELLEPIQDYADNDNVEELLKIFSGEKQISVVKETDIPLTNAELEEYGLDKPSTVFIFKNNLGQSKNITVGSVKNFENNSYLRLDSENRIILAGPAWVNSSGKELIHYREKKLYRHSLAKVINVKAKSLRDNFELKLSDGKWVATEKNYVLDQNKVRDILKKLTDTNIVEYVFEGEPSAALIKEKGLNKDSVFLELQTEDSIWSVSLNLNIEEKALYALTERPTFLVKIDLSAWETFGNLDLDQLRDRSSALAFNLNDVQKIFYKRDNNEINIASIDGSWKIKSSQAVSSVLDEEKIKKAIYKIHDLKISEFLDSPDDKDKFEGKDMLILRSATEKLILQLNWGPSFVRNKAGQEKEYYYARTQLSDSIFAMDKSLIDSLDFDKMYLSPKADSDKAAVKTEKIVE